MALSSIQRSAIKIKARPSNYGVNQISIGVVTTTSGGSNDSWTNNAYTNLLVARGMKGHPGTPIRTSASAASLLSGTTYTFTVGNTSGMLHGAYIFMKSGTQTKLNGYFQVGDILNGTQVTINLSPTGASLGLPNNMTFTGTDTTITAVPNGSVVYVWSKALIDDIPTSTTQLGIDAHYHVFDTGYGDTKNSQKIPSTTSPGKGVYGNPKYQGLEAYYGVFINDQSLDPAGWSALSPVQQRFTKDYSWYVNKVKGINYGKTLYDEQRSTINWMLNSLPEMYKVNVNGNYNNDLKDFLSLFAFQFDTYRTAADAVFNRSMAANIEEALLKPFLQQFGVNFSSINNDVYLGRNVLANIISAYESKGSIKGIGLAAELFTGYAPSVSTTETNLIPTINDASFVEGPFLSPYWVSAVGTTTVKMERLPSPSVNTTSTSYENNGVMSVSNTVTQAFTITSGFRYMVTATAVSPGSTDIPVNFIAANIGDYIVLDSAYSAIPVGASIDAVLWSSNPTAAGAISTVTLNTKTVTSTIPSGTKIWLSNIGPDKVAASAKMIPVSASSTYAYSFYANAWGNTVPSVQAIINWYDKNGDAVGSTSAGSLVAINNTWTRVTVTAVSPSTAAYAAPGISSSTGTLTAGQKIQFDAFQFESGSSVTTFTMPSRTSITLTAVNAVRAYDAATLSKAVKLLKDFRVSSFIPSGTAVSTTYTVTAIENQSGITENVPFPDYKYGNFQNYPTATMVLSADADLSVGQTFSLTMVAGTTAANLVISSGIIIGVISKRKYRIARRDTYLTAITETTSALTNNLYINNPNPMVIATAAV